MTNVIRFPVIPRRVAVGTSRAVLLDRGLDTIAAARVCLHDLKDVAYNGLLDGTELESLAAIQTRIHALQSQVLARRVLQDEPNVGVTI
jgi:hypothetical protein